MALTVEDKVEIVDLIKQALTVTGVTRGGTPPPVAATPDEVKHFPAVLKAMFPEGKDHHIVGHEGRHHNDLKQLICTPIDVIRQAAHALRGEHAVAVDAAKSVAGGQPAKGPNQPTNQPSGK